MPFTSIDDLPQSIINALPDIDAQELFMNVFNASIDEEGLTEERAFMNAWTAIQSAGYKEQDNGTWRIPVSKFKATGKIAKLDEEQRLVFGWASIIEKDGKPVVDYQGDILSPEELENAAYNYILKSRQAGEMHEVIGVGKIVESIVFTEEKIKALGLKKGALPIGWWIGFKVEPEVYDKVKDGTYQMFSIGGKGIRELIDD